MNNVQIEKENKYYQLGVEAGRKFYTHENDNGAYFSENLEPADTWSKDVHEAAEQRRAYRAGFVSNR